MSQAAPSPSASSSPLQTGPAQMPVAEVLLVMGEQGGVLAGFDAGGTVLETAALAAAETPERFFETQVASHHLLAGGRTPGALLLSDARQLVIPEALYHDGEVKDYFRSCFYLSPEEDLVVTRVSGAPYRVVTACPLALMRQLKPQQPAVRTFALGAAVLHAPLSHPHFARVLLAPGASYLALWQEGKLLEATATETGGGYDLAYLLLALAHKNNIAPEALTVQVESLLDSDEAAQQLEAFIAEDRLVRAATGYPDRRAATFARIRSCVS